MSDADVCDGVLGVAEEMWCLYEFLVSLRLVSLIFLPMDFNQYIVSLMTE